MPADCDLIAYATSDPQWDSVVALLSEEDIHFSRAYHQITEQELRNDARAFLLHVSIGGDHLIHVMVLRKIPGTSAYDAESVPGYVGPLATTQSSIFLDKAWDCISGWAQRNHIVAEFRRFHPLLHTENYVEKECIVEYNRPVVVVPLQDKPHFTKQYRKGTSSDLSSARKNKLSIKLLDSYDDVGTIGELYRHHMTDIGADAKYHYSDQYFGSLLALGKEKCQIWSAYFHETIIAFIIVLVGKRFAFYHLSAQKREASQMKANHLLLDHAFHELEKAGLDSIVLGGGRTPREEDSLLHFKKGFSRNTLPYSVGFRIYDQKMYSSLRPSNATQFLGWREFTAREAT